MKNKKISLVVLSLIIIIAGVALFHIKSQRFVPKRQNENQVIAYQDCCKVELYYHSPKDSEPVEIRVEFFMDIGSDEVVRANVQPDETVTLLEATKGASFKNYDPGIYTARIMVYDLESGHLKERIAPLELRIYHSHRDDYDTLVSSVEPEREIILDNEEFRFNKIQMVVDLKTEEVTAGLEGLKAEKRELNSYIYAKVDGKEILLAKAENMKPQSRHMVLNLEPGAANLLREGDGGPDARVDSYYADTGEFYDSIPAEILYIYRSE